MKCRLSAESVVCLKQSITETICLTVVISTHLTVSLQPVLKCRSVKVLLKLVLCSSKTNTSRLHLQVNREPSFHLHAIRKKHCLPLQNILKANIRRVVIKLKTKLVYRLKDLFSVKILFVILFRVKQLRLILIHQI